MDEKVLAPLIVSVPGVRGGRPVLQGTGFAVQQVGILYNQGYSVEDFLCGFPQLSRDKVEPGIRYYLDNRDEFDQSIDADNREFEEAKRSSPSLFRDRVNAPRG